MNTNIASLVYEHAKLRPSGIAFITDQQAITYVQLSRLVSILARHLRNHGIEPGQVVGVSMAHNPLHFMTILALAQVGAVSLPLHQAIPAERRLLAAQRYGANFVVSGRNEFALDGIKFIGLDKISFAADSPGDDFIHPATGDTPMRIVISSGTSGDPKGMLLTHEMMALRNRTIEAGATLSSRVITMDMNFIVGFRPAMSALARGAILVFSPSLTAEDVLHGMVRHRVTHAYFSPFQARDIAALAGSKGLSCPDLVCLRIGGGHIRKELLHAVTTKLSRHVYASYGSTESGMVTYATPEMLAAHSNTVGRVCEWATVEVVDSEDNLLASGTTGQLRVRSDHQFKEYYRDQERSRRCFRNGWFYPGDLGHFDAEGLLYIDGRTDEQINLGGMIINPEDIEATLAAHPAVIDAGVFVATEGDGNEVTALALVLNDPSQMDAIQAYARAKLGPLAPIRYFSQPTLPRTATGKLKRGELAVLLST